LEDVREEGAEGGNRFLVLCHFRFYPSPPFSAESILGGIVKAAWERSVLFLFNQSFKVDKQSRVLSKRSEGQLWPWKCTVYTHLLANMIY